MRPTICNTILGAMLAGALGVGAQVVPLHVGTTNQLENESGELLKGVNRFAVDYGFTPVLGEIVQVLLVTNAVFPPDVNGNPDPQNALLFQGRVGDGMDPGAGQTAMFGFSIPDRPTGGRVIARVFNKSSLAESSFYADSQVFYVSTTFNYPFIPTLRQTLLPLDGADPDGDGLINSWEKVLGSDAGSPDSDGDGVGDAQEWRAGTNPTDRSSLLAMAMLTPQASGLMSVQWDSVVGKAYQVEFRPGGPGESNTLYSAASGVITALDLRTSVQVTNAIASSGQYRVRLVELQAPL